MDKFKRCSGARAELTPKVLLLKSILKSYSISIIQLMKMIKKIKDSRALVRSLRQKCERVRSAWVLLWIQQPGPCFHLPPEKMITRTKEHYNEYNAPWAAMRIRSSKSALVNMTTTSHFSFQLDDDDGEMEHTDGVYFKIMIRTTRDQSVCNTSWGWVLTFKHIASSPLIQCIGAAKMKTCLFR